MKMLTLCAIAAGLALAGCGGGESQASGQQQTKTATAGTANQQTVQVTQVQSRTLKTVESLPAQIAAYESVDIYPKVTGFIDALKVDRGSRVRKGDVIVHLSAPELVAQRSQAEAALASAQSRLAAAQAKLAGDRATYQHLASAAKTPGVVAENDLVVSQQTAVSDQAEVEAATHNVGAARDAVRSVSQLESYLDIRAPFAGVVTARYLHPGALVGPNSGQAGAQPILRIESLGRLRIVVPVPEAFATGVKVGQQVKFTVPSFPGQTFHAPIARISHAIDAQTRTMSVELDVRNQPAITPGAFATVQWPVERSSATLFVPTTAVTTDLQRTFVIRVNQNKAQWVDVTTGVTSGDSIEVFGDLHAGDEVAVRGTDELRPGSPVTPQQQNGR